MIVPLNIRCGLWSVKNNRTVHRSGRSLAPTSASATDSRCFHVPYGNLALFAYLPALRHARDPDNQLFHQRHDVEANHVLNLDPPWIGSMLGRSRLVAVLLAGLVAFPGMVAHELGAHLLEYDERASAIDKPAVSNLGVVQRSQMRES